MTTGKTPDTHGLERLVSAIEDAWFEADDGEVLASTEARALAREARTIVEATARTARIGLEPTPKIRRAASRLLPRRAAPHRAAMRQLLVANPRARAIVGKARLETMSDADVEEALEKLAALGILPESDD